MKEIKLANGKGIALVDDEDHEILSNYKWFLNSGYARANMNDNNKLNNQKSNLRIVTPHQNAMNMSKRKGCSSIYKGVIWDKSRNKWQSKIKLNGKTIHLGRFTNEKDAAKAYDNAAKQKFGEYALINGV